MTVQLEIAAGHLEASEPWKGDVLSDVLRAIRLSGAVFFKVDATPPWVAEAPAGRVLAPHIMPGLDHVIEYHVIVRGSCWGGLVGEAPVRLEAGDILVFPRGDAHVMSSAPGMRGTPDLAEHQAAAAAPLPLAVRLGASGTADAETHVVCGFLGCDARPFNPLLASLPALIHLRQEPEDGVVRQLVRLAVAESQAPRSGGACVLSRLSELMFIEVVRRYVASLPAGQTGWFAGLRDPQVGRALAQLHQHVDRAWTLESLAKAVGASRSLLAERFAALMGVPPMQYLARWRMQVAAGLIASGDVGLAEIAERVGYGSEAALSRAFKRLVGVSPVRWRSRDAGAGAGVLAAAAD
jgi:AraC-like DNA-binding protein